MRTYYLMVLVMFSLSPIVYETFGVEICMTLSLIFETGQGQI